MFPVGKLLDCRLQLGGGELRTETAVPAKHVGQNSWHAKPMIFNFFLFCNSIFFAITSSHHTELRDGQVSCPAAAKRFVS